MYQSYMQISEVTEAARAEGLSYGQWVAKYRQAERPAVVKKSAVRLAAEKMEAAEKSGVDRARLMRYFQEGKPLSLIADKLGISLDEVKAICKPVLVK